MGGVQTTNGSVIIEVPRWEVVPNPLDGVAECSTSILSLEIFVPIVLDDACHPVIALV